MTTRPDTPVEPTDVVAIDGPSGAGKSTVARRAAEALGFQYLDTGAMYRAVTWHFLELGLLPDPTGAAGDDLQRMQQELAALDLRLEGSGRVLLDGRDVTAHLRSREVESRVSAVSALPFVRQAMARLQRRVAAAGPIVAEGRDMGSVVFPRARWKVYLDAAPSERARRRQRDFEQRGRAVGEREVLEEIQVRDRLDSTRKDAPLRQAEDAHYVDTTTLTTEQVVAAVLALVRGQTGQAGQARSS